MKRVLCLICIFVCLLLLPACGKDAQQDAPVATEAPTEAPTASPEPVTMLHVTEPTDAGTVSALIEQAGTVETVEINPGMLGNGDIALLLWTYPEVTFRYAVKLGDTYFPPGVTELSVGDITVPEIVSALPCLTSLNTVHLGTCTPDEFREIRSKLPGIELTYALTVYGRDVDCSAETLDLSDLETLAPEEMMNALPYLPRLKTVSLGVRDDLEAAKAFRDAIPSVECTFIYRFTYLGKTVTDDMETLDLSGIPVTDIDELKQTIALLPKLNRVEMIDCGPDNETMGALCAAYPDIKFVWEVDLGYWGKLRTDATAYSTRSRKTDIQVRRKLRDDTVQCLQYCTDLIALDLGHQSLTDLSFLRPLKKLRVLILADNYISDISVLGELPELEYIELFMNRVEDVSPLQSLTKLQDLNICSNLVADFKPLCSIKTLRRLWYARNSYLPEDHAMLKEALPDCLLNYTVRDGTGDGWRKTSNGKVTEREQWKNAFFEGAPRFE